MAREVELSTLDLRYEGYRMRNRSSEGGLLSSMAQRGIEEPLEGVERGGVPVLLNGFKRVRCARKLGIKMAPYKLLGEDESVGIMNLLKTSNNKALSLLEQAVFIDELRNLKKMSVAEMAAELSRSKAWVSMRLGLMGEMSAVVRRKLFAGDFPVYSYMYTLRQFMRMNGVKKKEIEDFMIAVSGKKLSIREIEYLAHGYFRGPTSLRDEIHGGHIALSLERMRRVSEDLRNRAGADQRFGNHPEIHGAGDGEKPSPAALNPGVSCPGQFAHGRNIEPGKCVFSSDEGSS